MNKEDLGKRFIKDDVVYEAIGYTDNPTMELINRETGNRLSVVIGSDYANEFVLIPEDKKIPEKLTQFESPFLKGDKPDIRFSIIIDQINEIIDYLKSKGE